MAAPRKTISPGLLSELYEFSKNSEGVEYQNLGEHFLDAGWVWRLRESAAVPAYDGTVLMSFDLLIGRSMDSLEALDTITMRMPQGPGPVSFAARVGAAQTLIYMVYGRMPPKVETAAAAPAPTANGAAETHVEMRDRDTALADDRDFPPDDDGGAIVDDDLPPIELVDHTEPDGLPIFVDLYGVKEPTAEVIETLFTEVEGYLRTATEPGQVLAVWTKNDVVGEFLRDLGSETDRARMQKLLTEHKERVSTPPAASASPRRRSAARAAN